MEKGSKFLMYYCHDEITSLTFRTFVPWGPTSSYGICYSFNFDSINVFKLESGLDVDLKASESVVLPGPGYGLSLVLNIEQEQYGGITETEGAR